MSRRTKKLVANGAMPTEAILESISDGVFTVDLEQRVNYFNRAAEQITGLARTHVIGRK
jgi:PAS domain S-box-containing protein